MVSIKKFNQFFIKESEDIVSHVNGILDRIESKVIQLFDESNKSIDRDKRVSDAFKKLHLDDSEQSSFARIEKNFKVIFSDESGFRYDVKFEVNVKEAASAVTEPAQGQEEKIETCDVYMKRYDENFDECGVSEKKGVEIDNINEDLFEELLLELQKKYPLPGQEGEEFEIETE